MSRDDVGIKIIQPMLVTYVQPRDLTPEEKRMALEAYFMALRNFDVATLGAAWEDVVTTTRGRSWPVPGVFVAAAVKAARERRDDARRAEAPRNFQNERDEHWLAVRTSPKARNAVDMGVALALKLAIVESGKRLHEIDLQRFVVAQISAARTAERIEKNLPPIAPDGRKVGVLKSETREIALSMYRELLNQEALVEQEIADAMGAENVAQASP